MRRVNDRQPRHANGSDRIRDNATIIRPAMPLPLNHPPQRGFTRRLVEQRSNDACYTAHKFQFLMSDQLFPRTVFLLSELSIYCFDAIHNHTEIGGIR